MGVPPYYRYRVVDDGLGQEGCSPGLDAVLGMVHEVGTDTLPFLLLLRSRLVKKGVLGTDFVGLLLRRARNDY